MRLLFQSRAFLSYWLEAVDEHSLHSPFFFDLYSRVIRRPSPPDRSIEDLRRNLHADNTFLDVNDLGSRGIARRTVSDIARKSLSTPRFSQLYQRIIQHFDCKTIVELGTSLGVNTLYLSSNPSSEVITFEGASSVAELAQSHFKAFQRTNIRLITGDISELLEESLSQVKQIDFAFIDANHKLDPTMQYFGIIAQKVHDKSVIVIDDIHWSKEMEIAWQTIRESRIVHASIDLFRCGMVFFTPQPYKQHVVLQY